MRRGEFLRVTPGAERPRRCEPLGAAAHALDRSTRLLCSIAKRRPRSTLDNAVPSARAQAVRLPARSQRQPHRCSRPWPARHGQRQGLRSRVLHLRSPSETAVVRHQAHVRKNAMHRPLPSMRAAPCRASAAQWHCVRVPSEQQCPTNHCPTPMNAVGLQCSRRRLRWTRAFDRPPTP